MKITSSIHINAPIEKVFDAFSDLGYIQKHVSGISNLEVLEGSAKLAVGTTWVETREVFGKQATETMTVTSLAPNKQYVVTAASHGSEYISTYMFDAAEGGTKVTMTFEGKPISFMAKLMTPIGYLFRGSVRKLMEKDMGELKEALER